MRRSAPSPGRACIDQVVRTSTIAAALRSVPEPDADRFGGVGATAGGLGSTTVPAGEIHAARIEDADVRPGKETL